MAFRQALLLQQTGQNAAAEQAYRAVLQRAPNWVGAHFNLGVLLLAREAWREGFQQLEWRLQKPSSRFKTLPRPRWQGQNLSGKRIAVLAEYGYGDMIQFWRFLPQLCERAGEVILELPAALLPLASHLDLPLTLLPEGTPLPACEYVLPMLSLPAQLGVAQTSEIAVLPPWKNRALPAVEPIKQIGLVWQGRQTPLLGESAQTAYQALQGRKAFPLALMADWVRACPDLLFYPFQPEIAPSEQPLKQIGLAHFDSPLAHFAQTATYLRQMDLVISVDSAVAHLAASLGRPTWLLLPEPAPWLWPSQGETTPWYPTLRIFRQALPGDWASPATEIALRLAQTTGTKGPQPV